MRRTSFMSHWVQGFWSRFTKWSWRDLARRGFRIVRQKPVSFEYQGLQFEDTLHLDLLVEDCVVVEIKSVERLAPAHPKQVLTYLRLMKLPVGLLLNFGAATMKEGITRVVNRLDPAASPILRVNQLG